MDGLSEYDVIADNDDSILQNIIIAHINIRSLYNKFDDVKSYILSHNFDIFSISETWLTEDIKNFMIEIPGYTIFRQDRRRGRGGGVAVYVRICDSIKNVKVIWPDNQTDEVENVWFSCNINGNKVCIGCLYRPPNTNYKCLGNLQEILADILVSSDYVFCLGDFNINFLNTTSPGYRYLKNWLDTFGLTQIISKPTHVTQNNSTLIDLFLTNRPDIILRSNVINMSQYTTILYMVQLTSPLLGKIKNKLFLFEI